MFILVFITVLLVLITVVYCAFILRMYFINDSNAGVNDTYNSKLPVSLVIIARNEAYNLPLIFECILKQDYQLNLIQIVLVDDNSTDATKAIVNSYVNQLNINYIALSNYKHITTNYKKNAQAIAVKTCKNNFIICVDADVTFNKNFVGTHVHNHLNNKTQFQYGSVDFKLHSNSLTSMIDYAENQALQALTQAMAHTKKHVLCNGANMAFSKQAYLTLQNNNDINAANTSGDDVFLMQQFINAQLHVSYINNSNAVVNHATTTKLAQYLQQRARWISKQSNYTNTQLKAAMYCIGLQNLCMPLIHCCLLTAFFTGFTTLHYVFITIIIAKLISDYVLIKHQIKNNFILFTLANICYSWLVIIVLLYSKYTTVIWKNRPVR
jgi:poly-beta-1,6-N-acetyl-D-glucosamine synthase